MKNIHISRQKHDELLNKNVASDKTKYFVNAIMYMKKYKHTFSISGVTYYNVKDEDVNILN
jgi:hypothetical protein